jgi:hypothetical protein
MKYQFKSSTINAGRDAKTSKGNGGDFITAIMYLKPAFSSGLVNVCPMAVTARCEAGCLNTAGRGQMNNVQSARQRKTERYATARKQFLADLVADIERFCRYCAKHGLRPAIRLNGTSDIQWEIGHQVTRDGTVFDSVFHAFPDVQFYDYTKITKRVYRGLPANYRLVLSYSEANLAYAESVVQAARDTGANVAVVYRTKALRDSLIARGEDAGNRFPYKTVIDGDSDDMRFLDPQGVIVGLYAKGRAKTDESGFVID